MPVKSVGKMIRNAVADAIDEANIMADAIDYSAPSPARRFFHALAWDDKVVAFIAGMAIAELGIQTLLFLGLPFSIPVDIVGYGIMIVAIFAWRKSQAKKKTAVVNNPV